MFQRIKPTTRATLALLAVALIALGAENNDELSPQH